MRFDLCVIGGCGHVGLPLSIAFALRGKRVAVFDIDRDASSRVGKRFSVRTRINQGKPLDHDRSIRNI
jgi:UDP-N-acetyl-D-mannosaminuronate dehydrogenase